MDNRAYAGFFVRLVAYVIDSIIAFVIAGIVKLPLSIAAGVGVTGLKANFLFNYSFIDVVGYLLVVTYFVLMTYFAHATIGKKLLNIKVITEDDSWTFVNVLYRETIGRFLSGMLCIGYFVIAVTEKKQGFHDMFCDTYVVYDKLIPAEKKKVAVAAETPVSSAFIMPDEEDDKRVESQNKYI
ncbi:MAG: RDD family protein [Lachnospiraceae bacterium]|nr:RDD family protein [Lachnospiraceae bacterium]